MAPNCSLVSDIIIGVIVLTRKGLKGRVSIQRKVGNIALILNLMLKCQVPANSFMQYGILLSNSASAFHVPIIQCCSVRAGSILDLYCLNTCTLKPNSTKTSACDAFITSHQHSNDL